MTKTVPRGGVRPELRRLTAFATLGILAGVAAKAADESGLSWAAVFFAAMTLAYYAWAAWVLDFGWSRLVPVWLLMSATAVAGTAVGAWWATRRPGVLPAAVLALAAGITLAGGEFLRLWWAVTGADLRVVHPVQGVVDAMVAPVHPLVAVDALQVHL